MLISNSSGELKVSKYGRIIGRIVVGFSGFPGLRPEYGLSIREMACRDGYSRSNTIPQPAAYQAKWSSRNSMRDGVVIRDFFRVVAHRFELTPVKTRF
jgi:hypothetical protein